MSPVDRLPRPSFTMPCAQRETFFMAKRLTDTNKWQDEWYLGLDNDYRIIWQYILDTCNHAGILKKSFSLMNFCCHTKITEDEFRQVFEGRVVDCKTYYFIPKFITFQYGHEFESKRPVVVSVIKELKQKGLFGMIDKSLGNDSNIIKRTDTRTTTRTATAKRTGQEPFSFIPPKEDIEKIVGRK